MFTNSKSIDHGLWNPINNWAEYNNFQKSWSWKQILLDDTYIYSLKETPQTEILGTNHIEPNILPMLHNFYD
jgi:hypothetical protein